VPTFKGRWTARVDQEFEVDAESETEAIRLVEEGEMNPRNVVELLDFDIEEIELAE
jgi:hypothetical protein